LKNLEQLYQILDAEGIQADATQLAEAIWLSKFTKTIQVVSATTPQEDSTQPIEEQPQEKPKEIDDTPPIEDEKPQPKPKEKSDKTPQKAKDAPLYPSTNEDNQNSLPFRTPLLSAFSNDNTLIYALRHFRQKKIATHPNQLDEEKIADYLSSTKIFKPFYQKSYTKRFSLTLIIDSSPTMEIWESVIDDFIKSIQKYYIFNDIIIYYLDDKLYTTQDQTKKPNPHWYKHKSKDDLIWILSDMVSPTWEKGEILAHIAQWQKYALVAIIQMLPKRLWNATKLLDASIDKFQSTQKFSSNPKLYSRTEAILQHEEDVGEYFKIPIINFTQNSIDAYGSMMRLLSHSFVDGAIFENEDFEGEYHSSTTQSTKSLEQRLRNFYKYASTPAKELLELLAVVPLSIPIIKLVQQKLLPTAPKSTLAKYLSATSSIESSKEESFINLLAMKRERVSVMRSSKR